MLVSDDENWSNFTEELASGMEAELMLWVAGMDGAGKEVSNVAHPWFSVFNTSGFVTKVEVDGCSTMSNKFKEALEVWGVWNRSIAGAEDKLAVGNVYGAKDADDASGSWNKSIGGLDDAAGFSGTTCASKRSKPP